MYLRARVVDQEVHIEVENEVDPAHLLGVPVRFHGANEKAFAGREEERQVVEEEGNRFAGAVPVPGDVGSKGEGFVANGDVLFCWVHGWPLGLKEVWPHGRL